MDQADMFPHSSSDQRDCLNLVYDFALYAGVDEHPNWLYGAVAYRHMARAIGAALLRDLEVYSGDDRATLCGLGKTFIITLVGRPDRIAEIFVKLLEQISLPLWQVNNHPNIRDDEELVYDGIIDGDGNKHPVADSSLLACIA